MDDKSLDRLEDTLKHHKYAPKPADSMPAIENLIEAIDADYKKLGEDIDDLKRRLTDQVNLMNTASETILNLIRTTTK